MQTICCQTTCHRSNPVKLRWLQLMHSTAPLPVTGPEYLLFGFRVKEHLHCSSTDIIFFSNDHYVISSINSSMQYMMCDWLFPMSQTLCHVSSQFMPLVWTDNKSGYTVANLCFVFFISAANVVCRRLFSYIFLQTQIDLCANFGDRKKLWKLLHKWSGYIYYWNFVGSACVNKI